MTELPLVTIRCITYNHEPYIRECLEGFVMQKTNFKFEAIVHDDASTDGTADIIREYAERHPDIIKPIYQTENQYSKKDGSIRRILNENTRGKYVALCEGDDYWTDPNKLQKQVDFLERNEDFSMCFHKVNVISENNLLTSLYSELEERIYDVSEVIQRWLVPTCSTMMLSSVLFATPYNKNFKMGDNVTFATCGRFGKLYCLSSTMAVYRRSDCGVSSKFTHSTMLTHWCAMLDNFPELSDVLKNKIAPVSTATIKISLKEGNIKQALRQFKTIKNLIGTSLLIHSLLKWYFFIPIKSKLKFMARLNNK